MESLKFHFKYFSLIWTSERDINGNLDDSLNVILKIQNCTWKD